MKDSNCNTGNSCCPKLKDWGLLLLRVGVGAFIMTHGWAKLSNFSEIAPNFMPFMGLSPQISLGLIVFAEFFCGLAIVLGLLTRLATIPLIIGMGVASFLVHHADPFQVKELPMLYLIVFVVILLIGPGKLSFDNFLYKRFCPRAKRDQ